MNRSFFISQTKTRLPSQKLRLQVVALL